MKPYLLSLGVGLIVGIIYALLGVRSPAPPVVALVGLFGILVGEQVPPVLKGYLHQTSVTHAWLHQIQPQVFGQLPTDRAPADTALASLMDNDTLLPPHQE